MSAPASLPRLGLGIGWRPEIAGLIAELPGLRFCEVVAEALAPHGRAEPEPPPALEALRGRGVTVVPHGTRLSLGGAEPLDPERVGRFVAAARALDAPLVSEHVAFVRAGGMEAGHLLPIPRTREALGVMVRNVGAVQAELDVPLALEPIAALFDWPEDELTEADFLTELLDRTGALLLLDVANVYANARNRDVDPLAELHRLPLERVAYAHVAGGEADGAGIYHDTHTATTPAPVLDLVHELCARARPPALLLERDGHYPPAPALCTELDAIADAAGLPRITPQDDLAGVR
ncbi:DUF692 domain-containing protein [Pseudonocardia acaciae]|uniref:DUF692 domain-containing protein n=1 Tax=Pseudonocardia acaciae TaxID=551276 RepID=UPI00048A79A0|nr:DUF692 domain-containing protein [Pseudonocardia acaciae]